MWYVHKYDIAQQYGGPEEGGWWFDTGVPVEGWLVEGYVDEEAAYERSRELNGLEAERQKNEEDYEYTSVLSHRSCHYAYRVEDFSIPRPFPETRPHYE
jgi:hypothetical protein